MGEGKINLFEMNSSVVDLYSAIKVLNRKTGWAKGADVRVFEEYLSKMYGKTALAFNSGTSALYAMLKGCMKHMERKGKFKVIVPAFTFVATVNAVVLAGGDPCFVDIELDTMALDHEKVLERIDNIGVGAVLLVHYAGMPARDAIKIRDECFERGIYFLEDCAESFGAKIYDDLTGTLGEAAILSFCQNKIITTAGEGGALVTNDPWLVEVGKLLRDHGFNEAGACMTPGFNFRMPSISAAVGLTKLMHLDEILRKRKEIGRLYSEKLRKLKGITLPKMRDSVYQMFPVLFKNETIRDYVKLYLQGKNIETKAYFKVPVHCEPYYMNIYNDLDLPNTMEASRRVLCLPMHENLSRDDVNRIINELERALLIAR